MSLRPLPSVPELLEDPERALTLAPVEAAALLARLAGVVELLRVAAAGRELPQPRPGDDRLLAIEEAARVAGVSRESFLRRHAFRPAIVRQGHRTLRVNERKLRQVLAQMEA